MLDPFPLPAPPALVSAFQPLARTLGLATLPLHIHEVLFAFALYTFIGLVLSPLGSNYFCGPRYRAFNRRTKINWNVHVVSFCQACVICGLSLATIWGDEERKGWRDGTEEGLRLRIWGYDGMTGLVQSFALGYFVWDFIMCSVYVEIFGWGMLAHAVSAVSVFALGYRPFCYFYCPVFLLYELSSPFLNIHWFCDKLDLTGSTIQAVNGAFLTGSFFCARIVWGLYSSFHTFNDMFAAYSLGHANPGIDLKAENALGANTTVDFSDTWQRAQAANDTSIAYDASGQQTAFMGSLSLPLWLPIIYVLSNLTLNLLNIWWFYKMVATIRKRFDPPWGTKGVGPDVVHYEPLSAEEKARIAQLHGQGKGSVKAGRVAAEKKVGPMGVNGGVEGVEVQRGVDAQGHKSVEVTGTQRRSARSRRKA